MPPKRSSKKGAASKTHKGDKDYTTKRGDKDFHEDSHDVKKSRSPYRKGGAGGSASAGSAPRKSRATESKKSSGKTEVIKLRKSKGAKEDGEIKFKKGTLHKQLKVPESFKFSMTEINRLKKIPEGESFDFEGHSFKKGKLMSKRINLAKTLMSFKH